MGAYWWIIRFDWNPGIPQGIKDDLSLGAMLRPPFNKPHGWLAFWFKKIIFLMQIYQE